MKLSILKCVKFVVKLKNLISVIINYLFLTEADRKFIKHNKYIWKKYSQNSTSVILVDFFPLREYFVMLSYVINILMKRNNSKAVIFSKKPIYWKRVFVKLLNSININDNIVFNKYRYEFTEKIALELFESLRSKNDLIELRYKGILIGIDIYETYLRTLYEPTVDIKDVRLYKLIEESINSVEFLLEYFKKNKVTACILSHDNYLPNNIVAKIAYKLGIDVYLPNSRGLSRVEAQFDFYKYFLEFKDIFKSFSFEQQEKALLLAKERLETRLSGRVGVDMHYSTKSAFHANKTSSRVVKESTKYKLLILTHDFYDNPHAYSKLIFPDFYEWLKFLIEIAEDTDYEWYIKTHPDATDETLKIIDELFSSHKMFTIVPSETSHFQMIEEGIDVALTIYGSVGHEYPFMGVNVISAGYNPHIAYDFNYHVKDLVDYEYILKNLDKLNLDIEKKDIYECYFLHYYYSWVDDIIFDSYRDTIAKMANKDESAIFSLFLEEYSEDKNKDTIDKINAFLDSKEKYFFRYIDINTKGNI